MIGRSALKWGVVLGVAICVWTLGLHFLGWYTTDIAKGLIADQVVIVLPLVALYLAIRSYERAVGRTPKLLEALGTGVLTGLVSVVITIPFFLFYHHRVNPGWTDVLVAHERERLARTGASAEATQTAVTRLIGSGTDSAQIMGAIIGTIFLSVVISLVVWGFLRLIARRPRVPAT